MASDVVTVSPAFRRLAIKAVLSIILFIFTYLVLFALSVGLTILCGWGAFLLVSASISVLTICIGFGLLCMGGMITFFLLKFIFAEHKVDRSHLTEITREEEPALFALVEEIVREVKTDFPKKIYLSADVNAAVFYDSSFWSMFLPVRKNLQIGVGLVNSVTRLELKAILAHEFGHFSQRSMTLGSYVYNVNKVIYNMLYDNASYQEQVSSIASASGIVAIFIYLAVGIVQCIQWILKKNYALINLIYMGLSREMEFHADAVAATVTGSAPLVSSLLRSEFSDQALEKAVAFYNQRYQQSVIPANIYLQQRWLMKYHSPGSGAVLTAGLPMLTANQHERYNKSKLVIKDQWASHPATEERIAALHTLNIHKEEETFEAGNNIFKDAEKRQEDFTTRIFSTVSHPEPVVKEDVTAFKQAYEKENPSFIFPEIFNGYYDQWNPSPLAPDGIPTTITATTPALLFGDEKANLAHSFAILKSDRALLHEMTVVTHNIKTFDYDGAKYSMNNIQTLIEQLDTAITTQRAALEANDSAVYSYFHQLAQSTGAPGSWEKLYSTYYHTRSQMDARFEHYTALVDAVKFMEETLPYAKIEEHIPLIKEPEQRFKTQLSAILEEEAYQQVLLPEQTALFTQYISMAGPYFQQNAYDEEAVKVLYDTLRAYPVVLDRGCQRAKLSLLNACAQLIAKEPVAAFR